MADTSADEFSAFPVESFARFLSVCGHEDPNLVRRARSPSCSATQPLAPTRQPAVRNATHHETYLEELVSIAISSARKAEDAVRQVHAARASARRRSAALGAFGAAGLLVGLVTVAGTQFGGGVPWVRAHTGGHGADVEAHAAMRPAARIAMAEPSANNPARPAPAAVSGKAEVRVHVADNLPVETPVLGPDVIAEPPAAAIAPAPAPVVAAATPVAADQPPAPAFDASSAAVAEEKPLVPIFIPPAPLPPNSQPVEAPRPVRIRNVGGHATLPSQLVAAVEALESLTDEQPANRGAGAPTNNRM